ncbi:hypothetical protein KEJ15_08565 [Candidatus Bathyarchaeota archaeon]|nr:hypothetical protein [Candidatus Bathyarchaeota archaeon]
MSDPDKNYNVAANKLRNKFINQGLAAATYKYGECVYVLDSVSLNETEESEGVVYELGKSTMTLTPDKNEAIICDLISSLVRRRLQYDLHYKRKTAGHYYESKPLAVDLLEYYNGFKYAIEVFPDGRVGLWLDPDTVWKQPISRYIEQTKKSNEEIRKYLIGKTAVCPSIKGKSFTAEIADVSFKSIGEQTIEGKSLYDYWVKNDANARLLRRMGIQLQPTDAPIITVQASWANRRLDYPYKLLELSIDLLDPELHYARKIKKVMRPYERIKDTVDTAKKVVGSPLMLGQTNIEFDFSLFDWSQKNYAKVSKLSPPILLFGSNGKSDESDKDPRIHSHLQQYGPITKKEQVGVICIFPKSAETHIAKFFNYLNRYAKKLQLPSFNVAGTKIIEKTDPDEYTIGCKELKNIAKDNIVLVVLPKVRTTEAYEAAKKGLGELQVSSQMVSYQLMEKMGAWDGYTDNQKYAPILQVLAVQMYDKCLKAGEAIWHLANPVAGVSPDKTIYFMGFDVSRNPEKRTESAAYAAICDTYGRVIHRKTITHKGERIHYKVLSQWFFEAALDAYLNEPEQERKKVDEIILFKDGPILGPQLKDYVDGANEAKKRLVDKGIMGENGNIRIVSVVKHGPYRLYGAKENNYTIDKTALIRSDKTALIVTCGSYIGTPVTLRLNLDYQITDDMKIEKITHMFNELRYLDWSSLYRQPKTILPLHIVQNLAKLSKEDIEVPYIPR